MNSTDLVKKSNVRELVAAFAVAEAVVRAAFAAIVDAETKLNTVFSLGGDHPIRIDASRHGYHDSFDDPGTALLRMRRAAWAVLIERLELRRMMSIARFAKLTVEVGTGDPPALTEENLMAFIGQHVAGFDEMIQEAVVEVFDWLRPRNTTYKTNSLLEVGERVVLSYMVEANYSGGGFTINHRRQQHLIALENVFSMLDGRGSITKTHYSAVENAVKESTGGTGETEFFAFKCFGNQNMHLRFKRLDLLDRFNRIAGGAHLKEENQE